MATRKKRTPTPSTVACPTCAAPAGSPCAARDAHSLVPPIGVFHAARQEKEITTPDNTWDSAPGWGCLWGNFACCSRECALAFASKATNTPTRFIDLDAIYDDGRRGSIK